MMFISFFSFSQDEEEEKGPNVNSNRRYHNEIGIDLSPFKFLTGDYSAGYPSLFYRRHFIKKKEIKSLSGVSLTTFQAFRFRIGSNLSFQKFNTPDIRTILLNNYPYYYYTYNQSLSNNSSFFLRIGKERQVRSRRFELFYGYDFFFNYDLQQQYYLNVQVYNVGLPNLYNINYENKYNSLTTTFGVAAIGGFKYFLIPRLCFSAEATLNLGYSNSKNTNEYNTFNTSLSDYNHRTITLGTSGFKAGINPLFVINAGYYF